MKRGSLPTSNVPSATNGWSFRLADEHTSTALLEKTRFDEVLKHDPAHLLVEACHLRGVSGGELHTVRFHEQKLDTGERFLETPRRGWLRHVFPHSFGKWAPLNDRSRVSDTWLMDAEIALAYRPPRVVPGL
jgi:hypothetical protein